jgi:hypothetical protein
MKDETVHPLLVALDITEVKKYHSEPEKLIEKINQQASHDVFDVETKQGRDACRSHAALIIKCITPAINASKELAADAQKVIKADLNFRKKFESGVREIADFHRQPLTEYEEEQKRIEEAKKAEEQFHADWAFAIEYNELDTLRKEKAKAEAIAAAKRAKKEQEERDERIRQQAKIEAEQAAERQRLRAEAESKAKLERAEREAREAVERAERQKIEAEQAAERQKLAAEKQVEQAAIDERKRIEAQKKEEDRKAAIASKDKEHRRSINNEILVGLIEIGCTEKLAKEIIILASTRKLGQLKINY